MQTTLALGVEAFSPHGKHKLAGEQDNQEGLSAIDTVELIKQTIKGELKIVSEVKTAVDHVKQRIDSVEAEVTKQIGGTMQLL